MYKPAKSEDDLTFDVNLYLPLRFAHLNALETLLKMKKALQEAEEGSVFSPKEFRALVKLFVRSFKDFNISLQKVGIKRFPEFVFKDLAPMFVYTLARMRRILPRFKPTEDPISLMNRAFDDFKELVWPDKRSLNFAYDYPDGNVPESVIFGNMNKCCEELESAAKLVTLAIESHFAESKIKRPEEKPPIVQMEFPSEINEQLEGIKDKVEGISVDSKEIRRVTTQHNNRDRRDHGLEADQAPIDKEDCLECQRLWAEVKVHPEWLDLKPKQRVMRKPAYAALIKMGKLPKSIKNYQDFKRALDNARK